MTAAQRSLSVAGFMQGNALAKAAAEFTDVDFIFIDGWAFDGLDNIAGIAFKEEQCGYFAGYAVVKEGYTKLGFTGGGGGTTRHAAVTAMASSRAQMQQLLRWASMSKSTTLGSTAHPSPLLRNSRQWLPAGMRPALRSSACGGSMFQSVAAAASANDAAVVGVDVDQSFESTLLSPPLMKGLADATKGLSQRSMTHLVRDWRQGHLSGRQI